MSASNRIAVVDYGMGNLRSVVQALGHVASSRAEVMLTADPAVVSAADRVVFPGQGAMRDCMAELAASGLRQAVLDAACSKPFFGICVGAQLLLEHSEEGDTPALGFFPGNVRRFASGQTTADGARLKVPHMGWNEVRQVRPHPLFAGVDDAARFYFVHSYYVDPEDRACIAGTTRYGIPFTGAVARDNIFAIQCHPEKSAQSGLALLSNFVEWTP